MTASIRSRAARALVASALFSVMSAAGAGDWHQSKWGENDEIGAANNLSPEKVLEASKLIKQGKTYSLGITVDRDTPAYAPRSFELYVIQPNQQGGVSFGPTETIYNDDILQTWLGIGTQIDGLGHIGIGDQYYNGFKTQEISDITGMKKLGIEKIPPIVSRGVLLDMTAHFKTDMLKEGMAINRKEIEAAAKAQKVEIRKGDVVLLHTGWLSLIGKDNKRFSTAEPGLGLDGAKYLAEKGVVAVGADNWGLEVIPFEKDAGVFEVHQTLLAKNGVYILENINTKELAADKAYEFMFVLGQPKYAGAVQSIINPIAIR
jgi:kynurenine formamidase